MKFYIKGSILGIVEAIAIFMLIACLNMIIKIKKGNRFFISGIEPAYQQLFKCKDKGQLDEMNKVLFESFDNYKGYYYYDISTTCYDSKNKQHELYMANEYFNQNLFFPNIEGNYINFKSDKFEILVGGEFYKNKKIGDTINITLEKNNLDKIIVEALIVGKINERMFRYPEAMNINNISEMVKDGFIVSKDTYINELVDIKNKSVMLNFNTMSDEANTIKEKALEYGVFVPCYIGYSSKTLSFLSSNTCSIMGLLIGIILIAIINTLFILSNNRRKYPFKLISLLAYLILFFIYNNSKGIVQAYSISYLSYLGALIIILIPILISLLINKNERKIEEIVRVAGEYEKI